MNTLTIEITSAKAYQLLKELEDLQLIKVLTNPVKLSSLRGKVNDQMDAATIDERITKLREEWQRGI